MRPLRIGCAAIFALWFIAITFIPLVESPGLTIGAWAYAFVLACVAVWLWQRHQSKRWQRNSRRER